MSTQSIKEITICELREGVDKALAKIGDRLILSDKFGIKENINSIHIRNLLYYKKTINKKYSDINLDPANIEAINKLISNYT